MKKVILISSLIATTFLSSQGVRAEASKEENIGFASGALTGAAAGGPIGLIIGAAIGAVLGDQVEKASHLENTQLQLQAANEREHALKQALQLQQSENQSLANHQPTQHDLQWAIGGLNLNLMFTTNSADLSDNDLANIEQVAQLLSQYPQLQLKLDGYTDPRGNKSDNLVLSQKRVDSVKNAFSELGIRSERINAEAHGEIDGLEINSGSDSFAMARKVSVNFITQSKVQNQVAQN